MELIMRRISREELIDEHSKILAEEFKHFEYRLNNNPLWTSDSLFEDEPTDDIRPPLDGIWEDVEF